MSASPVKTHIYASENWGKSRFRASALKEVVRKVHFCAHANTDNSGADGQPATNHWSLFLEVDTTRAVRIDIVPGEPNSAGMVILEIKEYNVSNQSVQVMSSPVPVGTTVETILGLIINKGRDRYIFSPVGEGCRYWLWTLTWDMVEAHLLMREVAERVSDALARYWKYPVSKGSEPRAMVQGSFF
ncbi:hypothetical protein M405DRAFT_807250 [Rhizopogon salebrosus TDB-379]|nr:hypothetical protein M405DRAFT_807250 [Rhizopogon salebrosus TDB-379]